MKKLLAGIFVFILVISLAGCGIKEKLEQKAGEALAEKIIEGAGGGDVDIDGDKVTIKGESGEELTIGGTEWPSSELVKSLPKFTDGKVTSVLESPDSVMIMLESTKQEDVLAYFTTIKKEFSQENFEMNAEDMTSFSGKNSLGVNVALVYSDELFTITVTAPQE